MWFAILFLQGLIFGSLLWFAGYDSALEIPLPAGVHLKNYAEDIMVLGDVKQNKD